MNKGKTGKRSLHNQNPEKKDLWRSPKNWWGSITGLLAVLPPRESFPDGNAVFLVAGERCEIKRRKQLVKQCIPLLPPPTCLRLRLSLTDLDLKMKAFGFSTDSFSDLKMKKQVNPFWPLRCDPLHSLFLPGLKRTYPPLFLVLFIS